MTVCVEERRSLLAETIDRKLIPTPAGEMVDHQWRRLPRRFSCVSLDEFIVMPDHVHGILRIAFSCGSCLHSVISLPTLIGAFKSITTVAYTRGIRLQGWPRLSRRLWQRGYFDRVVRDEEELMMLRTYIRENPARWLARLTP